jgi:nicotinamidase-related amidase
MSERIIGRNPLAMSAADTAIVVIDVQEKLIPLILDNRRIVWNIRRLLDGAKILGLSALATEQYQEKLGPTVDELAQRLGDVPSKLAFSCVGCAGFVAQFHRAGVNKLLLVGIEAHVCVQQTCLDLLADGNAVYVAVDAIGSRYEIDYHTALRRMESAGATLTTTESALFEWCQTSGTPEFKQISRLVRELPPDADDKII